MTNDPVSAPLNPAPLPPVKPAPVPLTDHPIGTKLRAYTWFWSIAVTVTLLDQLTKAWIAQRMPLGSYGPRYGITVIRNFFYLVHAGNTGAAWSMFSGKGPILAVMALITLGAIFFWRRHLGLPARTAQISFGLLCGGTVGNLIDRATQGYVTDFLDFHFGTYIYPTFNVADIGVISGVALYILWSLRQPAPSGR